MTWEEGFKFTLAEGISEIQSLAREFAINEIRPLAEKIDKESYYPIELIPKLAKLGFLGVTISEKYGGSELSHIAYSLIIEELASECASTSIIVSAHNSLCTRPIFEYGSDIQKKKYLPSLCTGEKIGCFALSEPGTGSDASHLKCKAQKRGKEYVINGTKNWITNAPVAGVCILFAMLNPELGNKGICAFVHDLKLSGIIIGKKENKLGICGSPTSSITYDNVVLTEENLLSTENKGFSIAMNILNSGRIGVAAQAVGIARHALREALNYTKQRETFGKYLHEHQSIQNYLSEMIIDIDAARYLTISAATLKDKEIKFTREAAMAKLFASKAAVNASNRCVQIFGGNGYVKDFTAERHYRDAKITEIYEGTSEIQNIIISTNLIKDS